MSETNGYAAFFLVVLGILAYLAFGPGNTTAEADQMTCTQYAKDANGKPSSCKHRALVGFWKIAINNSAGKCSVLYTSRDGKTRDMISGVSLAFVDSDNWECRGPKSPLNTQLVVSMSDGNLAIAYVDLDHLVAAARVPIERADGFIGTPMHYWRLLISYAERARK